MVFQEVARALDGSGLRALELQLPAPQAWSGTEARRHVLRDGAAVRMVFGLSTPADAGTVTVTIPQRVLLSRGEAMDAGDGQAVGADWGARFSEEVMRSAVTLEATMPLARLTLGDLADFEHGQVIEFAETAQSQARLEARGKTLFVCEFASSDKTTRSGSGIPTMPVRISSTGS